MRGSNKTIKMGIEFSTEVRQAATVFTQYRNTIDIYTEDKEEDKIFYNKLFNLILETKQDELIKKGVF